MKKLTLVFIIIMIIISTNYSFATGQGAELIIYRGDTLKLLSLPLEDYLGDYEDRIEKYPILKLTCSTGLWRGYQGLWKLENDELFIIDVFLCAKEDRSIYNELFDTESPIKASWYTGELYIQHGKMIKYHHTGFHRFYEEETIVEIDKGDMVKKQHFMNGYRENDKGFPNQPDSIMVGVYRRINWQKLTGLSKDKKLYVRIILGEEDSLTIIKSSAPEEYVTEVQRVLDEFPKMRKFYSRGKPQNEAYMFPVIFSNKHRRKYAHK